MIKTNLPYLSDYTLDESIFDGTTNLNFEYLCARNQFIDDKSMAIIKRNISNYSGDARCMFAESDKLTSISGLDTSKLTDMSGMFMDCVNLTSVTDLDLSGLTTALSSTFAGCDKLATITIKSGSTVGTPSDGSVHNIRLTDTLLINDARVRPFFNSLPTVTVAHKITLSYWDENVVTDTVRKIATSKGWTVVN